MTWGSPHMLYLLAIPVIALLINLWTNRPSQKKRGLAKATHVQTGLASLREVAGRSVARAKILFYVGLALVAVALARPRWGSTEVEVFQKTREVIVAIDLSKSMLAEDIKPNRLERAKLAVGSLLDHLQGESVGLIVFAGSSFLQSPMSPDYQILRGFLSDLSPSFVPQGGTDYEQMLDTALDSFKQSDGTADRFLIVISDGESETESWKNKIPELIEQNVKAICLGFGTEKGALIPDGTGGYHKDSQGAVVLTKLESATLQELANKTNGLYRDANVWVDLISLIEETIAKGKAANTSSKSEVLFIERFQYFLAPGLFLIALSLYREFPSNPVPRKIKIN
ncbi:VWA domain-containing protein [Puniceicoccaceae bacterium K14]|nr:VWA domain-containing protein [Puniceicoccaceae bacterium K14]